MANFKVENPPTNRPVALQRSGDPCVEHAAHAIPLDVDRCPGRIENLQARVYNRSRSPIGSGRGQGAELYRKQDKQANFQPRFFSTFQQTGYSDTTDWECRLRWVNI